MTCREATVVFMWVVFAAVVLFDAGMYVRYGTDATISRVLYDASRRWWWFGLVFCGVTGALLAHFFAPDKW